MELLIGFLILFGMYLVNQFLNTKLEEKNNSVRSTGASIISDSKFNFIDVLDSNGMVIEKIDFRLFGSNSLSLSEESSKNQLQLIRKLNCLLPPDLKEIVSDPSEFYVISKAYFCAIYSIFIWTVLLKKSQYPDSTRQNALQEYRTGVFEAVDATFEKNTDLIELFRRTYHSFCKILIENRLNDVSEYFAESLNLTYATEFDAAGSIAFQAVFDPADEIVAMSKFFRISHT